jgi:hypothetical protein
MISQQVRPRTARQLNRPTAPGRPPKVGMPRRGRATLANPFRFRPLPIAGLTSPTVAPGRQTATPTRRQAQGRATDRLARSEARLVGVAVAVTITFCLVLVVYLGEYAQATRLSIELSQANLALHKATEQSEIMKDKYAAARSPQRIIDSAVAQGMLLSHGQVCYVGTAPFADNVATSPAGNTPASIDSDPIGFQPAQGTRLASSETHPGPGSRAATTN